MANPNLTASSLSSSSFPISYLLLGVKASVYQLLQKVLLTIVHSGQGFTPDV